MVAGCAGTIGGNGNEGGDAGTPPPGSDAGAPPRRDAGMTEVDAGVLSGPLPATLSTSATVSGMHDAPGDVVIAPGATLTVTAGATLTFAAGAHLIVHGGLVVTGAAGNIVSLTPEPGSGDWGGVLVEQGGTMQVAFALLTGVSGGATNSALTVSSTAGAVTLTDSTVDLSRPALLLQSTADIERVIVHNDASPPIDGPIFIEAGNPTLTDILVDDGSSGVDAIVVNGGGPQISHLTVHTHHCCIHVNTSTGMSVDAMDCNTTNYYGFMFYSSVSATGSGSNITAGASAYAYANNNPIDLEGNYWGGGAAAVGGGQAGLIDGTLYAAQPFPDAGMR